MRRLHEIRKIRRVSSTTIYFLLDLKVRSRSHNAYYSRMPSSLATTSTVWCAAELEPVRRRVGAPVAFLSCTVVVCTRNRPQQLERCLSAIVDLSYGADVLVVDNAQPQDLEAERLAEHWGARYVHEPAVGLSRARNRGARSCLSDVVAYVDDDAIPERHWLANLIREFADPSVAVVCGRILPSKVETEAERLFEQLGGFDNGTQVRRVDRQTESWFELACFGGLGRGGNMAFRRKVFESWGGFDVALGRGAPLHASEELYAFFSLIERGHSVVYAPEACVFHPFPETIAELRHRHLRSLTASTGFFTFLLCREPRYRTRVAKYLMEAVTGRKRHWRPACALLPKNLRIVTQFERVLSLVQGPLRYLAASGWRPRPAIPCNKPSQTERS